MSRYTRFGISKKPVRAHSRLSERHYARRRAPRYRIADILARCRRRLRRTRSRKRENFKIGFRMREREYCRHRWDSIGWRQIAGCAMGGEKTYVWNIESRVRQNKEDTGCEVVCARYRGMSFLFCRCDAYVYLVYRQYRFKVFCGIFLVVIKIL